MTTSTQSGTSFVGRYWRIAAVGVLGAVLAFAGSFLIQPTYISATRLLIQAQDTTFLSSTGQDLSSATGVANSDTSKTIAETYAAVATSRSVAVAVVDRLHLDKPKPGGSGSFASLGRAFANAYRCTRAFLSSGYCAAVDPREKAITYVQTGTTAGQLGSTVGSAAGLPGSYVLEVDASGTTAADAQAITDAVADQLVQMSSDSFKQSADQYTQNLQRQLTAANANVANQSKTLAAFKTANGITVSDEQQALSANSLETLRNSLLQAQADVSDNQAQLNSINASLTATSADQSSTQRIGTGRSDTQIDTKGSNPVYQSLQTQKSTIAATLNGLHARVTQLEKQINDAKPLVLNDTQSKLSQLEQNVTLANTNQAKLAAQVQAAQSNALSGSVDLRRIDSAALPPYPIAPKRLIYLLLGLLIGALAGGGLTWLTMRRRGPVGHPDGDQAEADGDAVEDDETARQSEELVSAIVGARAPVNGRAPAHQHDDDRRALTASGAERSDPGDGSDNHVSAMSGESA